VKTQGNHGSPFALHGHLKGKQSGSGITGSGTPFGRVTVVGDAGQTRVVRIADISSNVCQYQALLVQAMGSDVEVAVTLVDPDLACDPTQTGIWVTDSTATAGALTVLTAPTASAIRLSFTAKATVVVAAT
jgi:hypothetical protein